jgi:hypothetical protein
MTDDLRTRLAELADDVRPIDLRDRVLAGSRRVTIRNTVLASVAVLVVLALLGVGAARLGMPHASQPLQPGPSSSAPNGPLTIPPAPHLPGVTDLDGKSLEIPPIPGNPGCSGTAKLSHGEYTFPVAGPDNPVAAQLVLRQVSHVDVDHDGKAETVAFLRCSSGMSAWYRVLVYRADLRLFGPVLQTPGYPLEQVPWPRPDGPQMVFGLAAGPDGTVRLTVGDVPDWENSQFSWLAVRQDRTYRWDGHVFGQSAGPTRFATGPKPDPAVFPMGAVISDGGGEMQLDIRNRGGAPMTKAEVILILPAGVRPEPPSAPDDPVRMTCTGSGTTYHCPVGTLPPGGAPQLFDVRLTGQAPAGVKDFEAKLVSPDAPASSDGRNWVRVPFVTGPTGPLPSGS